jgi:hypothetical protein
VTATVTTSVIMVVTTSMGTVADTVVGTVVGTVVRVPVATAVSGQGGWHVRHARPTDRGVSLAASFCIW